MLPIQSLFRNRPAPVPQEKDALEQFTATKGFSLTDFGSYVGEVISHYGGQGGWRGIYEFQQDHFERLTDTLFNAKGEYSELSNLTMTNPYASACISTISDTISGIEWTMARETATGKRIENKDHPLLKLFEEPGLYDTPGTKRTRQSLFEPIIHHLYFAGEFFIQLGNKPEAGLEQVANGRVGLMNLKRTTERPLTFTILHPRTFQRFIRDTNHRIVGYEFRLRKGGKLSEPMYLSTNQVLHIKKYNSDDEERGAPRIKGAYTSLVQARMASMWNTNLSKTGGRVQGFFSPKGLKPGAQLSREKVKAIESYLDETLRERQDRNLPMDEWGYGVFSQYRHPA